MAREAGGGGGAGTHSRWQACVGRLVRPALLAVAVPLLGGCTAFENAMARVSFLDFMKWSPSFSAYEHVRPVPPHSVPYITGTGDPYEPPLSAEGDSLQAFGDTAKNPLPMDSATVAMGKKTFDIYCFVCHGYDAHGHGPVVGQGKFPYAPDLTAQTTVNRTDGYIYAVIRAGRGLMPSYDRIPAHLRWAVVDYVRHLQQQQQQQAGK